MTIKQIISDLVEKGFSYGKIAKEAGVSKATISRWHKGSVKANKNLEQMAQKNLNLDAQADIAEYPIFIQQVKPIREVIKLAEKKDHLEQDLDKKIAKLEKQLSELKAQKEAEKWKFTEDEKVILRNLPAKFKWIVRDKNGLIWVFTSKPNKQPYFWTAYRKEEQLVSCFGHLFQCIQFSDTEPCEFRKFI